jgi:integrase
MYAQEAKHKASAGSVRIKVSNGRLQLVFSHAGKRYYLSLGLVDSPTHRKAAKAKAKLIESDIVFERFDPTLAKYRPQSSLSIVTPTITPIEPIRLADLWQRYFDYKSPNASIKTIAGTYDPVTRHLAKCQTDGLTDPLKFRLELLQVTTESQARRTLMQLNACCKWAMKHGLTTANPFGGMYTELEATTPPPPKAFSQEQRDRIIAEFEHNRYYKHYAPLIKFLFWTGCRPCEAIGLRWGSITPDCSRVHFHESIVENSGRLVRRNETKTGVKRWFTCTAKLQTLLDSLRPESIDGDALVFEAPKGGAIGLSNFNDRAWSRILDPLNLLHIDGQKMTLYAARDTFITLQAVAGNSSTTIARWVGNSSEVIERRYLDKIALENLRPTEI